MNHSFELVNGSKRRLVARRASVAGLALLLSTVSLASAQDYRYALFEMPSLVEHDQFDFANQATPSGDVIGNSGVGFPHFHAVIWPAEGGVIDLGTLGGDYSGAAEFNSHGEIVGASGWEPGQSIFVSHAFLWRNGTMIDLGTLGGESSGATGFNDSTQVVGNSEHTLGSYDKHGFVYRDGKMLELDDPYPNFNGTAAFDINEQGEIVGRGAGLDQQYNAMLWIDLEPIDLGSLSGQGSTAYAINDHGVIVGTSVTANNLRHSVKWVDRQIIDIHTPSAGVFSIATDINNAGQIVGNDSNSGEERALILNPGEEWIHLKDLIPPHTRIDYRLARPSINEVGFVSVTAAEEDVPLIYYALLLTPVTPTMNLQGPQPGIAGERNGLRITNVTPGQRVYFYYSRNGGGARIPDCDLQQNALQLHEPKLIGSAIANQNGIATITKTVPTAARNQWILMQAVVPGECAISQLVVHRFE